MKHVTYIQTSDGNVHRDVPSAKRHAEKRYGDALTKLSSAALRVEKYTAMHEFIEGHLDDFIHLKSLKDDCLLEKEDNDSD